MAVFTNPKCCPAAENSKKQIFLNIRQLHEIFFYDHFFLISWLFFSHSKCVPASDKQKASPSGNYKKYTCECQEGFVLDPVLGVCVDFNECANPDNNPCSKLGPDSECVNLPGSYRCSCSMGFEYNLSTKKCEDIDECEFASLYCDHGPQDSVCVNYPGSFSCECGQGYTKILFKLKMSSKAAFLKM